MRRTLYRSGGVIFLALALPLVAGVSDAEAFSLPKRMESGKICRAEFGDQHMHAANGAHADELSAKIMAIRDWASFTALEYGRRWANWNLAIDHSMTCSRDKEAGVWRCRAEAQPCRT